MMLGGSSMAGSEDCVMVELPAGHVPRQRKNAASVEKKVQTALRRRWRRRLRR